MLMTETPAQVRAFCTAPPLPLVLPTMSLKLVLLASTRMMFAAGAIAWAHSTSRLSSTAHPLEPETAG